VPGDLEAAARLPADLLDRGRELLGRGRRAEDALGGEAAGLFRGGRLIGGERRGALRLLRRRPQRVELLGYGPVSWRLAPDALRADLPPVPPTTAAYMLKIA